MCSTVQQIFEAMQKVEFDLMVCDTVLLGIDDTTELASPLTHLKKLNLPIVLLTDMLEEEIAEVCESFQIEYVSKADYSWEKVSSVICRRLELSGKPPKRQEKQTTKTNGSQPPPGGVQKNSTMVIMPASKYFVAKKRTSERLEDRVTSKTTKTQNSGDSQILPLSQGPPTLLVIDDDPDICRALEIRMRSFRIRVFKATSGAQGIQMAIKNRPNLIICDFFIGDSLGTSVVGQLKGRSETKDIPVFVISGHASGSDLLTNDFKEIGAEAFFAKPLDFDLLLENIAEHIEVVATLVAH